MGSIRRSARPRPVSAFPPSRRRSRSHRPPAAEWLERLEPRQLLTAFTVTSAADGGQGSLKEAIDLANANPGADVIRFNIPNLASVAVIQPTEPLIITDAVTLDAATQPGYAGTPLVRLEGWLSSALDGLVISAAGTTVRALAFNGWNNAAISVIDSGQAALIANQVDEGGFGISLAGVGGNIVESNRIGTVAGMYSAGIYIGSDNNRIGGADPSAGNLITNGYYNAIHVEGDGATIQNNRIEANNVGVYVVAANTTIAGNIIAGNYGDGIQFDGAAGVNRVSGNLIGLDATGLNVSPNYGNGVSVLNATGSFFIGGDRNFIAGNYGDGVFIQDASGVTVAGNTIGLTLDNQPASNWANGVVILGVSTGNTIEGNLISEAVDGVKIQTEPATRNLIQRNTISNSVVHGIWVISGSGNEIRENSIYASGGLGIELGEDGATANDSLGHDGPNLYQDYPVIAAAQASGGVLAISGTLDVGIEHAGATYIIELFSNETANPSGSGEGQTFLGALTVAVDSTGHAAFSAAYPDAPAGQDIITATATDAFGNTSEFSPAFSASAVLKPATRTLLISSPNPSALGQLVTLTATVSAIASADVPTGAVTFWDGSALLGSGDLAAGAATFATATLSLGDHALTARYPGDDDFLSSASLPATHTVKTATTTVLISSANPSDYGQPVTFTAHVVAEAGALDGSVIFKRDGEVLNIVRPTSAGFATLTIVGLPVGAYSIEATYSGDALHTPSSDSLTQRISTLQTRLATAPATGVYAASTTLSATLTYRGLPLPNRAIAFTLHGQPVGTATTDAAGLATLADVYLAGLGAGLYAADVQASFPGDATYSPSSAAADLTVSRASATISLADLIHTYAGSPKSATASTDPAGLAGLSLVYTRQDIPIAAPSNAGQYTVLATLDNPNYAADPVSATLIIQPARLTITVDAANRAYGQPNPAFAATFAGFVGGDTPGSLDGSLVFSTEANPASPVGDYPVSAAGLSSVNYAIQYIPGALHIAPAETITTLASSASPVRLGQAVTFTATVASTGGDPAGTITFMDGEAVLAVVPVDAGAAVFSTADLSAGDHAITALYTGDSNHFPSASEPLTQRIFAGFAASGRTFKDLTGNGASEDDVLLGNVALQLFRDVNQNGLLDTDDGPAIASTLSDPVTGEYRFDNLPAGRFLVKEIVPAGFVRTVPLFADEYAFTATPGDSVASLDFYNAFPCPDRAQVFNIAYIINGTTAVADLRGNVQQGDTVEVRFQLPADAAVRLTLVSYTAPQAAFDPANASLQQIWEAQTGVFSGPSPTGYYSLAVNVPDAYFQVDFICGQAIDRFGPAGSNIFYTAQDRLYSAANGGVNSYIPGASSLSGFVYLDADNDGVRESGEYPITNVTVTLAGHDVQGAEVLLTATTDARGRYVFANIPAGVYRVEETQPNSYLDGGESLGSGGGDLLDDAFDGIAVAPHVGYTGYNFGELRGVAVGRGDAANIGFWHNRNGQALIQSLNGGPASTTLGNWLASTWPRIYGAGPNRTAGLSNTGVAALFTRLARVQGQKLDAQVLGAALAVFVTDPRLAGGRYAARYGFTVSAPGTANRVYNIGRNGQAFGVANNTKMRVLDVLAAANARAVTGVLYNGSASLRNLANAVFGGINDQGNIA